MIQLIKMIIKKSEGVFMVKRRNPNNTEDLSILGFGCMRFPHKGNSIDKEETKREILHAIEMGINYFDTAYIYPGSEAVLGEILEESGCRDKVNIASKLPHYLLKKPEDIEKYFEEQCSRLRTKRIDYYLMHMLPDINVWGKLKNMGILTWIDKMKNEGRIGHIGFSYHGNTQAFIELLEDYEWDFCQIQYNYMDEFSQAGRAGLERAAAKNIPVIIMEPLRGGRLVNGLPKEAITLFSNASPHRSPAEWALRWLWNQKAVTVVLSGMNSMEMLDENIRIASEVEAEELTPKDMEMFEEVKAAISGKVKIPCTGCGYCSPCPRGVDIPGAFRCYNASYTDGYANGLREYLMCTTMRSGEKKSKASLCVECGKCEIHCPQGIEIRKELKKVKKRFENPVYKLAELVIGSRYGK